MRFLVLVFCSLLCAGCNAQEPWVKFRGERFTVELAITQEEQALGLMFRESMPRDHGMLFIFRSERNRGFWMKNTRIPLDIFYFDKDLRLVSVAENAKPCPGDQCRSYRSEGPAKYVLELNGGMAAELGAEKGDLLELHID